MIRLSETFSASVKKRTRHDMDLGGPGDMVYDETSYTPPSAIQADQQEQPSVMIREFRQMLDLQKLQNNEFASMLEEFKNILNEIKQKRQKIETCTDCTKNFDYYT